MGFGLRDTREEAHQNDCGGGVGAGVSIPSHWSRMCFWDVHLGINNWARRAEAAFCFFQTKHSPKFGWPSIAGFWVTRCKERPIEMQKGGRRHSYGPFLASRNPKPSWIHQIQTKESSPAHIHYKKKKKRGFRAQSSSAALMPPLAFRPLEH